MRDWLQTRAMEIFILWGHKVLGFDKITLHLDKKKDFVIGITFGETHDKTIKRVR